MLWTTKLVLSCAISLNRSTAQFIVIFMPIYQKIAAHWYSFQYPVIKYRNCTKHVLRTHLSVDHLSRETLHPTNHKGKVPQDWAVF